MTAPKRASTSTTVQIVEKNMNNLNRRASKAPRYVPRATPGVHKKPHKKNRQKSISPELLADAAWAATLRDPMSVHGVRIPDEITAPSAVVPLNFRFAMNSVQDGATGNYGCGLIWAPTVNNCLRTITTYTLSTTNPTVTCGAPQSFPGYSTFNGLSRGYRVVSAGMAIYSTTAFASNQGKNLCVFYPGNDKTPIPISTFQTVNQTYVAENFDDMPINMKLCCSAVWRPTDRDNYNYHLNNADCMTTAAGTTGYYFPGIFSWMAVGVASTASFEVRLTLNIEYLPNTSTIGFIPFATSRYSAKAMENALNITSPGSTYFGTIDAESAMITESSNNLGWDSILYQAAIDFGSGLKGAVTPYIQTIARTAGYALGNRAMRSLHNNGPSLRRALTGVTPGNWSGHGG